MGVREFINRHGGLSAVAILVAAAIAIGLSMWFPSREVAEFSQLQDKAWFTVDDGSTHFAAPIGNRSPFKHEGKDAYRCYVFTCESENKPFVAYIERDPENHLSNSDSGMRPTSAPTFGEAKAPGTGETGWVAKISPEGTKLLNPRCPDGSLAEPATP
jgi:hypothetical protein